MDAPGLTCHVCGKSGLKNQTGLSIHIKVHSDGRDSLECDVCGKVFHSKKTSAAELLRKHRVKCGSKKRHRCAGCGESFTDKKKHRAHETRCEEYTPKCQKCGKAFGNRLWLSRHLCPQAAALEPSTSSTTSNTTSTYND